MNQYCHMNQKFEAFYNCINNNWYQPVVAAGQAGHAGVIHAMSVGNNLRNGVRAGQLTDADAIYRWRSTQMGLRQLEVQDNSRKAEAWQNFGRELQRITR